MLIASKAYTSFTLRKSSIRTAWPQLCRTRRLMCERSWRKNHSRFFLSCLNLENLPVECANSFMWNKGMPNCFSVSFQFRSNSVHCPSEATNPATTTASVSSGEPLSSKYAVNIQLSYVRTRRKQKNRLPDVFSASRPSDVACTHPLSLRRVHCCMPGWHALRHVNLHGL